MKNKIKKIKVFACDVDGILTDGKIIFNNHGVQTKNFNVLDGFGLVLLKQLNFKTAIITARGARVVTLRAKDLGINKVYLDSHNKIKEYEKLLRHFRVKDEEVCFMGDDLTDLKVLKRVGFAVSVPNGAGEVKRAADYITKKQGGQGAVREVVELILKTQGLWKKVMAKYA